VNGLFRWVTPRPKFVYTTNNDYNNIIHLVRTRTCRLMLFSAHSFKWNSKFRAWAWYIWMWRTALHVPISRQSNDDNDNILFIMTKINYNIILYYTVERARNIDNNSTYLYILCTRPWSLILHIYAIWINEIFQLCTALDRGPKSFAVHMTSNCVYIYILYVYICIIILC